MFRIDAPVSSPIFCVTLESTVMYTAKIIDELTTKMIAVVFPPLTCPAEMAIPVSVRISGITTE